MKHRSYGGLPMTPVVKRMLIVLAAIFVAQLISGKIFGDTVIIEMLALKPKSIYSEYQVWRLFTWMWLHGGPTHILLNCLFLWMFGATLELAWGSKGFLRFYLMCGIGSGLVVFFAKLLSEPESHTLGASGAIYGLVVAWAITFPNKIIYFFGLFPMKGKHFVLIPIGYAVVEWLMDTPMVSHSAHIGGMAIGALLVTGFWKPGKAYQHIRYWWLRRKLKNLEQGGRGNNPPPDGGHWH